MSGAGDGSIQISQAELRAMTRDLDQIDKDQSRPAIAEAVAVTSGPMAESAGEEAANWSGRNPARLGRRTFLLGSGALAGGLLVAACGSGGVPPPTTTTTARPVALSDADLRTTALATSLENLVAATYGAIIGGVVAGRYGPTNKFPAAVTDFATITKIQHGLHADAWNNVLAAAGKPRVTGLTSALLGPVTKQFKASTTLGQALSLALMLENAAAQTYQVASTVVTSSQGIQLAASIQPVEMQHAAILYYLLGRYPGVQDGHGSPASFNPVAQAIPVSDYTGPL